MKVLMLNTFDNVAGADRAACRLQKGLRAAGVDASLLVQFKYGNDKDILCPDSPPRNLLRRLKLFLGTLPVRLYPRRPVNNFTPALLPDRLSDRVGRIAPDILHLHWLGAGFCQIETIGKFPQPLIWTLHDSWAFTGGCHVPGECKRYQESCGACPVLGSSRENDLSRWTWQRKKKAWRNRKMTVVAPSHWLADCAGRSSLFSGQRIEVIPNGLDTDKFSPLEKSSCRANLGLPQDKKIILFGAVNAISDPNKGWQQLLTALQIVAAKYPDAVLAVFGSNAPTHLPEIGMRLAFLGHLCDEASLIAAYSAADVFVAPSLQETFCQTAAEAMACATPVVAFKATGLLDVVEHMGCGYLAQPYVSEDLARGIGWVLEDQDRHVELSIRARQKAVLEYCIHRVSARYAELYHDMLSEA